jgi:protein arginine N-methyltransferase 1
VRTKAFGDALHAVVRPDDVVVEIGVGTGVLSITAAQAGAKRVHGIESSGIAELAERVIAQNGVADRVTIARGRSTHVTLPERGTVLVTEMIGNDPLDEDLLEVVADAKRRLLAPGARIIPASITLWAVPVDVPRELFERHAFTADRLAAYRAAYGVDFGALAPHHLAPTQPVMVKSREASAWRAVAPPLELAHVDLAADFPVVLDRRARFEVRSPASHLGVLLAFRSELAKGVRLSTLPTEVSDTNHWRLPLWLAFDRLEVGPGDGVDVDYAYRRGTTTLRIG